MGGTVGSGLTPGSCQGRHKPEKPDPDPENPGKTGKTKKNEKMGKTVSRLFCFITAELGHLQT